MVGWGGRKVCGIVEQVEFVSVMVRLERKGWVVAAYFGGVVVVELERELHRGAGEVSDGFISEGELGLLFCGRSAPQKLLIDLTGVRLTVEESPLISIIGDLSS